MEVSPKHLEFSSPFTYQNQTSVTLHNNTSERFAFKVKTTAPKRYFVRPNTAIVEPGETQTVTIILQPYSEEPPQDTKCNDKFLLMQCPVPADITNDSFAEFWAAQEHEHADTLINKKLRVHYNIASPEELPALLAAASAAAAAAGVASGAEPGVAGTSPIHHHHHHHHQDDAGASGAPASVAAAATPALGVAASTPVVPQSPYSTQPSVPQQQIQQQPAHDQQPPQAASSVPSGTAESHDRAVLIDPSAGEIPGASSSALASSSPNGLSHAVPGAAANHAATIENRSKAVADEIEREKAAVFGSTKSLDSSSTSATAARGPTTTSAIPSNGPSSSSSTYGSQQQPLQRKIIDANTDIPLPQVIIMVIVSFLIGWFFF